MMRRSRTRRALKWVGAALSVIVGVVYLASLKWEFVWLGEKSFVGVGGGGIAATITYGGDHEVGGPIVEAYHRGINLRATERFEVGGMPHIVHVPGSVIGAVPLWIPLLLVLIPTAVVWWRSPRHRRGHCLVCGYNLTGNTSGRCPECGTPVERERKTA